MKICCTRFTVSQLSLGGVKTRAVLIYCRIRVPWPYSNSWSALFLAITKQIFIYHGVFEQVHLTGSTNAYSW